MSQEIQPSAEVIWEHVPGVITAMRAHSIFCLTALVVLPVAGVSQVRAFLLAAGATARLSASLILIGALVCAALGMLWCATLVLPRARWAWRLGWLTLLTGAIALPYTIPLAIALAIYWRKPATRGWFV